MTTEEMQDRIRSLEHNVNLLAEQQAQYAHFMHLLAKRMVQMSDDMDIDFEPMKMN